MPKKGGRAIWCAACAASLDAGLRSSSCSRAPRRGSWRRTIGRSGERFRFYGTSGELAGWVPRNCLAAITIIGWACFEVPWYERWAFAKVTIGNRYAGEEDWRRILAANFSRNFETLGATTNAQYGWPGLFLK